VIYVGSICESVERRGASTFGPDASLRGREGMGLNGFAFVDDRAVAADKTSTQAVVSGPKVDVDALPSGVYARVSRATARLRGEPTDKPLMIATIDYFRVDKGLATRLTSTEYTDIVQPLVSVPARGGKTQMGRAGSVIPYVGPPRGKAPEAPSVPSTPQDNAGQAK
jgi:hypothetical protein